MQNVALQDALDGAEDKDAVSRRGAAAAVLVVRSVLVGAHSLEGSKRRAGHEGQGICVIVGRQPAPTLPLMPTRCARNVVLVASHWVETSTFHPAHRPLPQANFRIFECSGPVRPSGPERFQMYRHTLQDTAVLGPANL